MNADREPNRLPLRAGAMLLLALAIVCIGLGWHSAATSGDNPEQALDNAGVATSASPATSSAPSTSASAAASTAKLCVFNAGSVTGLAGDVADALKSKGYTVASPQNLKSSTFTENTVFYDVNGDVGNTKAEAQKVAKDVPGGATVEKRPTSFTQCADGVPVIMFSR